MNASISAALLMLLLAGGWLLGRRRARPFLRSTDTSAVAALNRTQIERLQASAPVSLHDPARTAPPPVAPVMSDAVASSVPDPGTRWNLSSPPLRSWERRRWLRELQTWMVGTREQRLQVLAIASQSSRREALPLLHLGLRDPDPAVMAAAAAAMARFRGRASANSPSRQAADAGRSSQVQPGKASTLRPRRVLRTR